MAKVLIVDDEPMYREIIQEAISEQGHHVEVASDGHDATEISEHSCPDVLVVDWMLQNDRSGLEVSASLRESNPDLVTIIITGFPARELRAQAAEAHVFAFLEKPFELDDLRDTVRRAVRSRATKE